jgi:hypothetical protein
MFDFLQLQRWPWPGPFLRALLEQKAGGRKDLNSGY